MKKIDVKAIAERFDKAYRAILAKRDWDSLQSVEQQLQTFLGSLSEADKQHSEMKALKATHQSVLNAVVEDAKQLRGKIDQHQNTKEGLSAYSQVGMLS